MTISKTVFPVLPVLLLAGCATTLYSSSQYSPPPGKVTVDIEFVALDDYRTFETVELFIYRSSCAEKYILAPVASIGSKKAFYQDTTKRATARLPANEVLNLSVHNTSVTSAVTLRCNQPHSFTLEANRRYSVRVNNWKSSDFKDTSFGCAFQVVEMDDNGKELRTLPAARPQLPKCPN
jgi:hypothetical protein